MPKRLKIERTTFRVKKGGRCLKGIEPTEAVAELERIRSLNGDLLSPRAIWEHSKKASSLLNGEFTWDDSVAGALYRDEEARNILQQIEIVREDSGTSSRAWCRVVVDDESGYIPVAEVLVSEVLREQVISDIRDDLARARKRLSDFEGFTLELASLDRVIKRLDNVQRGKASRRPAGPGKAAQPTHVGV